MNLRNWLFRWHEKIECQSWRNGRGPQVEFFRLLTCSFHFLRRECFVSLSPDKTFLTFFGIQGVFVVRTSCRYGLGQDETKPFLTEHHDCVGECVSFLFNSWLNLTKVSVYIGSNLSLRQRYTQSRGFDCFSYCSWLPRGWVLPRSHARAFLLV